MARRRKQAPTPAVHAAPPCPFCHHPVWAPWEHTPWGPAHCACAAHARARAAPTVDTTLTQGTKVILGVFGSAIAFVLLLFVVAAPRQNTAARRDSTTSDTYGREQRDEQERERRAAATPPAAASPTIAPPLALTPKTGGAGTGKASNPSGGTAHKPSTNQGGAVVCRDGSVSSSCRCGGSLRGCCSRHGGVAGCQ